MSLWQRKKKTGQQRGALLSERRHVLVSPGREYPRPATKERLIGFGHYAFHQHCNPAVAHFGRGRNTGNSTSARMNPCLTITNAW